MLMPAEAADAKDRLGAALGGHRRTVRRSPTRSRVEVDNVMAYAMVLIRH